MGFNWKWGLGIGVTVAGVATAASSPWWYPRFFGKNSKETSFQKVKMWFSENMFVAVCSVLTVIPAIFYGGYYVYNKYTAEEPGEVRFFKPFEPARKRQLTKNKKKNGCSAGTVIIVIVVLFVLVGAGVGAYFMLSGTSELEEFAYADEMAAEQ